MISVNSSLVLRVRYHAARGLIYLGCFDVGSIYLFKRVPGKKIQNECRNALYTQN